MNYNSYKEAYEDMKECCDRALENAEKAAKMGIILSKKYKVVVSLLINCAEYITESIGDKDEANEVLASLGLTQETLKSLL